jgi:hydrogenase maturation protein HypF
MAIQEAINLLSTGQILAIKGLGGFHLACNAKNQEAVAELRRRKLRVDKPFALMMPDIDTIETHCYVSPLERNLLLSRERPIVILKRKTSSDIVQHVAPQQETLGVMLPYTPLHYLLFPNHFNQSHNSEILVGAPLMDALVMTSGNLSEEPIAASNSEARERLLDLADAFLMHNRPIRTRCDDSVIRVYTGSPITDKSFAEKSNGIYPLRRSRGYVPYPVYLPWRAPSLLATGAELKNTFCITRERYAFLSHHIGDLENYETLQSFEDGIEHLESLFRIKPEAIAYDTHPNYLASRYALERADLENIQAIPVQHHHAHIASCMVENNLPAGNPVIGVSFDGTGYGDDGAIWGGEFLLADYRSYIRYAHLAYIPLPGGDLAIRTPARVALAYLWRYDLDWDDKLPPVHALSDKELAALQAQLKHNINTPPTSSMGRLFDAVAALAGVRQAVNYEAQAAIEFEAIIDQGLSTLEENQYYPFDIRFNQTPSPKSHQRALPPPTMIIHAEPLLQALIKDLKEDTPVNLIASRFHNGVAEMVRQVCNLMRDHFDTGMVALSGGVWQNMVLLNKTIALLKEDGFQVIIHAQVPANDGGIALGQAAIAIHHLRN